ncbi:hypothetical protein RJ639_016924 [Escallonia herrerae]|uniref:GAG-pre-integrase domain-containing protein n=1 Tax=Escallonia herrerae TaxID=1293975 RepID=A0AA88VDY2_9ASTE|nr:hypothetical protein RJ639_016924 [Escallonia herrerae]
MTPNTSTKNDLEKFDGSNDFSLWRMKMRDVLIQQELDWFATYRSFDGGKVLMGNDVACKVVGISSIQIRMHDGILSGCSGVMRIMKGALVVMKGLKQNSLYLLQGSRVTGAAATTSSSDIDSDTTKLWHMRLAHMSEGYGCAEQTRIFGCPAYAHVNDGKLEPRAKKCIFLGYENRKRKLIDAGKDHGVREKVELEIRAPDSLPIIPTDKEDSSHSTEENEEPQE